MNDKKITSSIIFAYVGSGANVDVLKFSHEKGLFKKHGVDMTPIYVADGVLSTQAVISGRASAATAPVTDVIAAIAKGAPLKIIMVNSGWMMTHAAPIAVCLYRTFTSRHSRK